MSAPESLRWVVERHAQREVWTRAVHRMVSMFSANVRSHLGPIELFLSEIQQSGESQDGVQAVWGLEAVHAIRTLFDRHDLIAPFPSADFTQLTLGPVLEGAINRCQSLIRERRVRLACDVAAGHSCYGDGLLLGSAMMTILLIGIGAFQESQTINIAVGPTGDWVVGRIQFTGIPVEENRHRVPFSETLFLEHLHGIQLHRTFQLHHGAIAFDAEPGTMTAVCLWPTDPRHNKLADVTGERRENNRS